LEDDDVVSFHQVYESVLLVDSTRPTTGEHVSKRFGFSDPFEWGAHRFVEKAVDSLKHRLVVGLPIEVVLPPEGSEYKRHYESV
jgi:hypothetical protein